MLIVFEDISALIHHQSLQYFEYFLSIYYYGYDGGRIFLSVM